MLKKATKENMLAPVNKFANEFRITFIQSGFVGLTCIMNVNEMSTPQETIWMPMETFTSLINLMVDIKEKHQSRIITPKTGIQ
jgi:hypothetical protein